MRSLNILSDKEEYGINRAVFKSMGYSEDDISRPIIGIANAWNTLVPGHFNLKELADHVKRGIYRGGCTAVEFGVIAVCDGTAQGHKGMHYALPSRELIANDIETMAEAHQLDGLVLMGSCDKIVPGMLMAAARLDIPSILINGGPMLGGSVMNGRKADLTSTSEGLGMLKKGSISQEEYDLIEECCSSSCGSCSFYGTANTMCVLSEAMGMTLTGGALIPAPHPDRIRVAEKTGEAICKLVKEGITARKIITQKSMENAISVCVATSGSTNAVLHLSAIAYEACLDMDVVEAFDSKNKITPVVCKVNPSSAYDMEDFYLAGGVPRVMDSIKSLLHLDALTVSSENVGSNLDKYKYKYKENIDIIRSAEDCFEKTGGISILRGNLAPQTAVSKPGAIDPEVRRFCGLARVFNCEEDAEKAILAGTITPGDVVVIRYEGPKGGPGMREMYKAMKYLKGMGLSKNTAVITDGRFSGTNNGCFVGHISPEAAEGGPIAIVNDGDQITIDVISGELTLHVSEKEISERFSNLTLPEPKFKRGYLSIYAKMVTSAHKGAIIEY